MLLEGEHPVLKVHRHAVVLLASLWLPLLLVVVTAAADILLRSRQIPQDVALVANLGVAAVFGAWAIVAWFRWAAASITITDRRVILEDGILSRSSKVIALDRVQDVTTRQGLLGRVLGYGRIEIDAAGATGAEVFDHLRKPRRVRDEVFVQTERFRHPEPEPDGEPERERVT